MRRTLLTCTVAALAAAAFATPASAYKDVSYAVDLEGKGTYESLQRTTSGDTWHEEEAKVDFVYAGDINDGVVFRDGHPLDTASADLTSGMASGSVTIRGDGGSEVCTGATDDPTDGFLRLMEADPFDTPLDGERHMWLRPFDVLRLMTDCPSTDTHPEVHLVAYGDDTDLPGKHTFDIPFAMPPEVFGMGYVEQLLPVRVVEGERCPGYDEEATLTCRLEWSGKVTFRKLWEQDVKPTGAPQPPSIDPRLPAPAPKPKPVELDEDDWLVPLVKPGSAKVDAKGTTASFTLTCPAGCAGTASIAAPAAARARAAAAAVRPLVSKRFRAKAGKATRVKLRLGARARRSLRRGRAKHVDLKLQFTKPARGTRTLRLRLPRVR